MPMRLRKRRAPSCKQPSGRIEQHGGCNPAGERTATKPDGAAQATAAPAATTAQAATEATAAAAPEQQAAAAAALAVQGQAATETTPEKATAAAGPATANAQTPGSFRSSNGGGSRLGCSFLEPAGDGGLGAAEASGEARAVLQERERQELIAQLASGNGQWRRHRRWLSWATMMALLLSCLRWQEQHA
jgi:hypothetical protein